VTRSNMKYALSLFVATAAAAAVPKDIVEPGPDGRYTLEAPGIKAQVSSCHLLKSFSPIRLILYEIS
jgi:hypothetical protein